MFEGSRKGRLKSVGLAPVVAMAAIIGFLTVFGQGYGTFNIPALSLGLQLVFVLGTGIAVAYVSARAYNQSGSLNIVLLGTALLISGMASTVSLWTLTPNVPPTLTPNEAVTIGNLGIMIAAFVLFLSGIAVLIDTRSVEPERRRFVLTVSYVGGLVLVMLITILASSDVLPAFLTSGGPTVLRIVVLTTSVILILISSLLFALRYQRSRSTIIYWHTLGLALFGLALVASVLTVHLGEAMNWASKTALYLSAVYFFVAIQSSGTREEVEASISERWANAFRSNPRQVSDLFTTMTNGFLYGKIVDDASGKPTDVIILDANRAFETMNGVKRADMLGRRVAEVFPALKDDPENWLEPYRWAAMNGESLAFEQRSPSTRLLYRVSVYSPQRGHFVALYEDITERKRSEEALHSALAEAEENQRLLNVLLENAPIGIGIVGGPPTFPVIRVSRYGTEMAGLSDNPPLGMSSGTHQADWHILMADGKVPRPEDMPLYRSTRFGEEVRDLEMLMVAADGRKVPVMVNAVPIRDRNGNIVGAIDTFDDITERKRNEASLKEYALKLERSNAELQQFAYVASHDLQEPLRMVTAYLSLLEKKYGDRLDQDAKQYMDFAIEGGLRARDLIRDLLEVSRLDSQDEPMSKTNMNEVVDSVTSNLAVQIGEEHALVTHDPLPEIVAVKAQILLLMQNLVSNAIKFHGDKSPKVHIACEDRRDLWLFSVKDNGIGIDPQFKDKIFIIFQRLHSRDEYEGTGIGLAISKKIVERHGGKIWFDSTPGQGTKFYFTIPKGGKA